MHVEPLTLSVLRPLISGLRQNRQDHAQEVAFSRDLGYRALTVGAHKAPPAVDCWPVSDGAAALGLGHACPFDDEKLVFSTRRPLFSPAACRFVRREAAQHIAGGGSSSFTLTLTNRDADVHSLPRVQRWLNSALSSRLYPLAAACFGSAVAPAQGLFVYRSLVVQYDAAASLTHQPTHRDGALISVIVPLNPPCEYEGGGTELEALHEAIVLPQGHALLHPSSLRHAARRITRGERWVLVVFLGHARMRFAEHGRRFKARAAEAGEEGDVHAELALLRQALVVCPDDGELWYDAGGCLHDLGELEEAARHYATSIELNPHDPNPHTNLGALLLGRSPRAAFACFRRALTLDPYHTAGWLNAGRLLLEVGRPRAARSLLARAPACVLEDPEVLEVREELDYHNEGS